MEDEQRICCWRGGWGQCWAEQGWGQVHRGGVATDGDGAEEGEQGEHGEVEEGAG